MTRATRGPVDFWMEGNMLHVRLCAPSDVGPVCGEARVDVGEARRDVMKRLRDKGATDEEILFHGDEIVKRAVFKAVLLRAGERLRLAIERSDRAAEHVISGASDEQLQKVKSGIDVATGILSLIYPGLGTVMNVVNAANAGDPKAQAKIESTVQAANMGNERAKREAEMLDKANQEIAKLREAIEAANRDVEKKRDGEKGDFKKFKRDRDEEPVSIFQLGLRD